MNKKFFIYIFFLVPILCTSCEWFNGSEIKDNKTVKNIAEIPDSVRKYLVEQDVFINPGDKVKGLTGANQSIGLLFTRFPDSNTADLYLADTSSWMRIDIA